jgi:hypothetical protein
MHTVTPTFDPASPASLEVTEQGMYLTIGNLIIDLEAGGDDPEAHADALDQAGRILAALAHELPAALADVAYHRWLLGEKCETCRGRGGVDHGPFSRHAGEFEPCPHCDGTGRVVADRMPAA